jgi:hypothetical protein
MTEAEWLACEDPRPMLFDLADKRKLRLFACAACRRIWELMPDDACREAIEASERYADGLITDESLGLLSAAAEKAWEDTVLKPCGEGGDAATAALYASRPSDMSGVLAETLAAAPRTKGPRELAAQAALLRDIFGNPFRPAAFDPAWRTDTALALAAQMYDSRDFGAMPILADALQEAGCESEDILAHCRDTSWTHVRGCWVVDLVLGKD